MTETPETAPDLTDESKAALQAVVESGQAQWYLSGGEKIEFTAEGFCRWHAAEVARVRAKVAEEVAAPLALSNAEMAALKRLDEDEYHEQCGEVWQRYFTRITRGEQP